MVLYDYFNQNRPVISDLVCIYYGIMQYIKHRGREGTICMESVQYNAHNKKIRIRAVKHVDTEAYSELGICRILDRICDLLQYADAATLEFAREFRRIYVSQGTEACLLFLDDYNKRVDRLHSFVTIGNIIYVIVVFAVIVCYYYCYGLQFY